MKKIFFIFAMLLMSVVSVWAEELSETISMTKGVSSYSGDHFTVSGNTDDTNYLFINGENRITITAKKGEMITSVKYAFGTGSGANTSVKVTKGTIDYSTKTINDINDTSLEIFTEDFDARSTIKKLIISYKENNDPIVDEYVKIEEFSTATGSEYTGTNINIIGVGNGSNGLSIGNGNTVTIGSNNRISLEISRIDLEFGGNVDGTTLNSTAGGTVDGEGEFWNISNVNSSSTTISLTSSSGYIRNIKVYYIEVPEESEESGEKTVSFITKSGQNYSKNNIIITSTKANDYGLRIDNGESVTIASDNGVEILKVDLHFRYYRYGSIKPIKSTEGDVSGNNYDWSISNVNSTSLTISHPGDGDSYQVQIDSIAIHYKERLAPSTIEVAARKAEVAYWATFYSGIANYQAPDGTRVYKVNFDGSLITMTEIEDRIVTKGQGVVLKNNSTGNLDAVNIVMTKTDNESSDDYNGNSLKGTGVAISNPGNAYVLNYKPSEGVGFYRLSSTGTILANRAYLTSGATVAGATAAAAREFFAFDAAITGIENVNAQDSEDDVKTFDLQGRRVTTPAKGVYIVNGKKVIMK